MSDERQIKPSPIDDLKEMQEIAKLLQVEQSRGIFFKAVVDKQGRVTIPQPERLAKNIEPNTLVQVYLVIVRRLSDQESTEAAPTE